MKKYFVYALMLSVAISLTACVGNNNNGGGNTEQKPAQTQTTENKDATQTTENKDATPAVVTGDVFLAEAKEGTDPAMVPSIIIDQEGKKFLFSYVTPEGKTFTATGDTTEAEGVLTAKSADGKFLLNFKLMDDDTMKYTNDGSLPITFEDGTTLELENGVKFNRQK